MIDFYKHSFLSILGKEAGSMTEIEYPKKVIENYDLYLQKLKEMKKQIEENGGDNNTEIYL
ncbi:MAG: hypothetical protein J5507_00495 [Clostridia bacterium]|nr:hypothetical protein [Clostridia bacterium]